jgi:hypothetical protein
MAGVSVIDLRLLVLDDFRPPSLPAQLDDAAIVELLAAHVACIRDDVHKVVMMQTLFGRRFAEVLDRLRAVSAG